MCKGIEADDVVRKLGKWSMGDVDRSTYTYDAQGNVSKSCSKKIGRMVNWRILGATLTPMMSKEIGFPSCMRIGRMVNG